MTHHILQVSSLPIAVYKKLQELGYTVHDHAHILDPEALGKVRAMVGMGDLAQVDRKLLSMVPHVKLIALIGENYPGVDVEAATERGITITHTPEMFGDDAADLAMGLMLAVGRRIAHADRFVRNNNWIDESYPLVQRLSGARLGLLGLGRVGRAVARRAAGFDMRIAYCATAPKPGVAHTFCATPAELAAQSDYLVVAVPSHAGTRSLVNSAVLQALGPKGYLINVARGPVVDEAALIAALQSRAIAGAGLDVFWDEPRVPAALRQLSQVVLTPHIGSATEETRLALADLMLANLQSFLEGGEVLTPIPQRPA